MTGTATQYQLSNSTNPGVRATVSSRAASLRRLSVGGIDIVEPTTLGEIAPGTAGAVLAPWPNRVEGAKWTLNGAEHRLAVSEPEFGHANHGLLLDTDYDLVSQRADHVDLRTTLPSRPGYPFSLAIGVSYTLDGSGVVVHHSVHNLSAEAAPFAIGAHPYVRVGEEPVESLVLEIGASRGLLLDDAHIPRGEFDVEGTSWDLRGGRSVASAIPHAAYTQILLEDDRIVHRLRSRSGGCVEVWADPAFAWVQVYVAANFPGDRGSRTAIAIEPMTAPPNALRTGEGLIWLSEGARWDARWGIRLV